MHGARLDRLVAPEHRVGPDAALPVVDDGALVVRAQEHERAVDREQVVAWLRRVRSSGEPVDLDEVRQRVVATTRASLDYDTLEIAFEDDAFVYRPVPTGDDP